MFGDSGSGPGVSGQSDTNAGVFGTSPSSGVGVEGTAGPGDGVEGTATTGYGVAGSSSGKNAGVGGFNTDTTQNLAAGVYGFASEGFGVYGQTGSSGSYGVYSQGNAFVDGEIFTSGSCKDGCSRTRHVAAFASRTSQPTIDDVGETILRDGAAHVALAADFANTIDLSKPYVVMLTPEGDAALYVASRTASGFDVREIGGGHSSIPFAYRIVAKPYGVKDERLPFKIVPDGAAFKQPDGASAAVNAVSPGPTPRTFVHGKPAGVEANSVLVEEKGPRGSAFGNLLRRHRLEAGLSQEDLAERARISAAGIGALERGDRRTPQRETLTLLANALGLDPMRRQAFEAAAKPTGRLRLGRGSVTTGPGAPSRRQTYRSP